MTNATVAKDGTPPAGRPPAAESMSRVVTRIATETATRRRPDYASEVRALLDAALIVIARRGTTSRARVADIVAEAGLSNEAFYRHFPSKDALVAALVEDGAERSAAAVGRRMAEEATPAGKVRRWVEGLMAHAKQSNADVTLAVLANSSTLNSSIPAGDPVARIPLAALLHEPLRELGSTTPELDAELLTHALLGRVAGHMWARTRPTDQEEAHLLDLCLVTATLHASTP
jgi:AcrR family transcriptional regulator